MDRSHPCGSSATDHRAADPTPDSGWNCWVIRTMYVRDNGLGHSLLGIEDYRALLGHPVVGASWEGFVIENLLSVARPGTGAYCYRTSTGAEMALVLEIPGRAGVSAVEIKRGLSVTPSKGFHSALEDLSPE